MLPFDIPGAFLAVSVIGGGETFQESCRFGFGVDGRVACGVVGNVLKGVACLDDDLSRCMFMWNGITGRILRLWKSLETRTGQGVGDPALSKGGQSPEIWRDRP